MFNIKIDGEDRLVKRLGKLVKPNIRPLLKEIGEELEKGNREGLLNGRDKDDGDMPEVKRSWGGSYLVPHGPDSRAITGFRTTPRSTAGGWSVSGGWPNLPWMKYHKGLVDGVRPETLETIQEKVRDFWDEQIKD